MNEQLSQREYSRLKSRLTRAKNALARSPQEHKATQAAKVVAEVDYALTVFDARGYPDQWHDWERSKEDAQLTERRA